MTGSYLVVDRTSKKKGANAGGSLSFFSPLFKPHLFIHTKQMSLHTLSSESFLSICDEFKLGDLPTESFHAKTINLSKLSKENLPEALEILKQVDKDALCIVSDKISAIYELHCKVKNVFLKGHKVFLCGCGATGRLSIALETLYRQLTSADNVISFMAGGDVALIKSIESFEDKVSYGARQLLELGFQDGDILISTTEGGETPFVIGATEEAAKNSQIKPYFLYCNPTEILAKTALRSKNVIDNESIVKIELATGPMALSGSTRMQASTVLMLSVGLALLYKYESEKELRQRYLKICDYLDSLDYKFLIPFIEEESQLYQKGEYLLYKTDSSLGISVLTDTTERSPTFSLNPFENDLDSEIKPSLSYLCLEDTDSCAQAWSKMLGRRPRVLDWHEFEGKIGLERIYGFDISSKAEKARAERIKGKQNIFHIMVEEQTISCKLNQAKGYFSFEDQGPLAVHLGIKVLFNSLSTLVMGRLGRYENNIMTWVRPSNYKLIDRSARYTMQLLKNRGITKPYEEIIEELFKTIDKMSADQSVVIETVKRLS